MSTSPRAVASEPPTPPRIRVYGSQVSYFTGKLEAYLRYKEIPYTFVAEGRFGRLAKLSGAAQMPAVELPDGRFMTDTTPMIGWLEGQHTERPVIPEDPLQAFVGLLIEDYADEWLWRPAMHFRWSYAADKYLLSRKLVDEVTREIPLPRALKRFLIRQRQLRIFVSGDGVDAATRSHVEASYLAALDLLSGILARRPFVFGERPSIADIGLMGPMLRHFSHDPTPAALMQQRAPAVWAWVARVWDARASRDAGPLLTGVPSDLDPLLSEIGETHLASLAANADAWQRGATRFDVEIQGTRYRGLPTSRYRVWCLEVLRARLDALPAEAAAEARTRLDACGCFGRLREPGDLDSGYDPDGRAPFATGLEVLTAGRGRNRPSKVGASS